MDGYPSQKAEKGSSMAIFKTETLKEKGLTQEQIDYIMAEAGKQGHPEESRHRTGAR